MKQRWPREKRCGNKKNKKVLRVFSVKAAISFRCFYCCRVWDQTRIRDIDLARTRV